MNGNGGQHQPAPLIHGRMIYRCESCGKSWPMYLEKGIEEFGENHKPSPFTIGCPHCGGWASDVSGIQKVPGGGYVPLPGGYRYFANREDRDCGVPDFYNGEPDGKKTTILIADELDRRDDGVMARAIGCLVACMVEKMREREIDEVARIIAEETGVSLDGAAGAVLNVMQQEACGLREELEALDRLFAECAEQGAESSGDLGLVAAWNQKEGRGKQRAIERANVSRFRQYKARENAWAARKRTGPRQREWRGPWRSEKN